MRSIRFGRRTAAVVTAIAMAAATIGGATAATAAEPGTDDAGAVIGVSRIAGENRFATAVALSQEVFPDGANVVYLVSGTSFPDALSAGPAAAYEGAPVLLTTRESLPGVVADEIARLDPEHVVIVGGEPSVSSTVEAQVAAIVGERVWVERIAGANRYETSALVATTVFFASDLAYVASGETFPDALSGGAAAGAAIAPLLLVYGQVLDPDVAAAMDQLGIQQARIVGSEASVSAATAAAIDERVGLVRRIAGPDRFATSVAVNAQSASGLAFLASGVNFPDALAGAAVAAGIGAPMYLTRPECIPEVVADAFYDRNISELVILGGTPSVSSAVEQGIVCG